jgi:hypothetical protein
VTKIQRRRKRRCATVPKGASRELTEDTDSDSSEPDKRKKRRPGVPNPVKAKRMFTPGDPGANVDVQGRGDAVTARNQVRREKSVNPVASQVNDSMDLAGEEALLPGEEGMSWESRVSG